MFNIADYSRQLINDFLIAGGKIETVEFHSPADLRLLPQTIVFNCTGYGACQLWSDESIIPVRGQIGWLIPQPEVTYGLYFEKPQRTFSPRWHSSPDFARGRSVRLEER